MSGTSPGTVLYSSDGTELSVVSGSAIPTGTRALLISGTDPSGNARYVPTSANGALGSAIMSDTFSVQSNATITTTGSALVTANYFGTQEIALIVNVTNAPTGTTPVITYTIQEVDPGNSTTVYGSSASTAAISATGVFTAVLNVTTSPMVKISWVVTGTTPSFTGVYATVVTKSSPSTQTVNGTVTATNNSVGADGAAVLGFDTQIGGSVTTAAPTYTTGNLNALSLTTKGGLRVDGVYPTTTTTANAPDAIVSGAYVTTAAPAYTTGQLNALSINTAGGLRIDGVSATASTTGTTAFLSGGAVTTAAPAYTAGQMDPLSLTTVGGLRIDGVYPTGTANASAPDAVLNGGYVTTAAPAYTTGQLNALSLTTAGSLRVDGTGGSFNNQSVGSDGAAVLTFDTQIGGSVTTAAPTYTTGNLNALSLTTKGGLRIDGVYPAATTNANATDVMVTGGYVTTSAPTYTTGQMNPLSLDTFGNLRVSAITNKASTAAVTSVAVTANAATSLLAANTSRVFGAIYNNTNKNAYVLLGAGTASTSNFTILLITGSYWELPVDWQGAVSEFSPNGSSGSILVTELTP